MAKSAIFMTNYFNFITINKYDTVSIVYKNIDYCIGRTEFCGQQQVRRFDT